MADEWNYRDEQPKSGRSARGKTRSAGGAGANPGNLPGMQFGKFAAASKLGIKRWMLVTPWAVHLLLVLYLFTQGSGGVALGIVLLVFGPIFVVLINVATFMHFARKAMAGARGSANGGDKGTGK